MSGTETKENSEISKWILGEKSQKKLTSRDCPGCVFAPFDFPAKKETKVESLRYEGSFGVTKSSIEVLSGWADAFDLTLWSDDKRKIE